MLVSVSLGGPDFAATSVRSMAQHIAENRFLDNLIPQRIFAIGVRLMRRQISSEAHSSDLRAVACDSMYVFKYRPVYFRLDVRRGPIQYPWNFQLYF